MIISHQFTHFRSLCRWNVGGTNILATAKDSKQYEASYRHKISEEQAKEGGARFERWPVEYEITIARHHELNDFCI